MNAEDKKAGPIEEPRKTPKIKMRWKLPAIILALVIATALVFGLTRPSEEQFESFVASQHISGMLIVTVKTPFYYSEYGYFDGQNFTRYLGILGRFHEWKLPDKTTPAAGHTNNPAVDNTN